MAERLMWGDGEMPSPSPAGNVEGSQKSKRVTEFSQKSRSRGSWPQCIRVKAPLRLVQPGWRGELLLERSSGMSSRENRRPSQTLGGE